VFRAAFHIKLTVNVVVALFAWGLAGTVSQWLGRGLEMTAPIRWAAVGGLGASLLGLSLGVLQARQRFLQYAILRPLANLLKVAALAAFWITGTLTLSTAIGTSALASFAALALVPWLTSIGFVYSRPMAGFTPGRAIVAFSAWLVAAKVLFALYARVDLLLIEYFGAPVDVAPYWIASSLLFLLDLTTFSVIVSLLPEASQIHDRPGLRRYVGSAVRQCGALAVLFLPALLFIGPIVELLYGGKYPETPGLFRILFWGSLATLVVHPLYLVLYARNKPALVALINLVQAVACAAGCWILVPLWGVTGAAFASMLARLVGCLLILATVAREIRKVTAAARTEELRQVL
jgi:O-antigen/teichoic acid export membrane protein